MEQMFAASFALIAQTQFLCGRRFPERRGFPSLAASNQLQRRDVDRFLLSSPAAQSGVHLLGGIWACLPADSLPKQKPWVLAVPWTPLFSNCGMGGSFFFK